MKRSTILTLHLSFWFLIGLLLYAIVAPLLKIMEQLLPANKFCRVHKSYIVSIDKIVSIERNCIKILDKLIPISAHYKDQFYSLTGITS